MSGGYFSQAGVFLIEVSIGLYIIAILLRYLLACTGADFYHPLSQFIVRLTNPALKPLRRVIPSYLGIDWPLIILLFLVQGLEIILIRLVLTGSIPALMSLFVLSIAHITKTLVYLYLLIILILIVISWVNPGGYNRATVIMYQLSEPVLKPARRLIPPTGGFDWSPLIVIVVLNLLLILFVSPLMDLGWQLA